MATGVITAVASGLLSLAAATPASASSGEGVTCPGNSTPVPNSYKAYTGPYGAGTWQCKTPNGDVHTIDGWTWGP